MTEREVGNGIDLMYRQPRAELGKMNKVSYVGPSPIVRFRDIPPLSVQWCGLCYPPNTSPDHHLGNKVLGSHFGKW